MWQLLALMLKKEVCKFFRATLLLAALLCATQVYAVNSGQISADEIIDRAVQRAKGSAPAEGYVFDKTTIHEERNEQGELKERKAKQAEIYCRNGKLVRKNVGHGVANEDSDPDSVDDSKANKRSEYLDLLTPSLMQKYVFSLLSRTNANGRSVFEIGFRPKAQKLPAEDLKERILNNASGRLYIDEAEYELVRADISMNSEISVGGFLGALRRAAFTLERVRLDTGIWFERFYRTDYEARKLTQVKRITTQSECANFRKVGG